MKFVKSNSRYYASIDDETNEQAYVWDVTTLQDGVEPQAILSFNESGTNPGIYIGPWAATQNPYLLVTTNASVGTADARWIQIFDGQTLTVKSAFLETAVGFVSGTPGPLALWILECQGAVFVSWCADGIVGYNITSTPPYLTRFGQYGKVGTSNFLIGTQWFACSKNVQYALGVAYTDGLNLGWIQIHPDGTLASWNNITLPSCASTTYPTPCSSQLLFPSINSISSGQEYLALDHGRGSLYYTVNADGSLSAVGGLSTLCQEVQSIGTVGNYLLLWNYNVPTCTCPSLTGACPLQLVITVTTQGNKSGAESLFPTILPVLFALATYVLA